MNQTEVTAGLNLNITLPYEQEFELYHNALSLCSMKVRVCLAELEIPYKSHHIDLIETGRYENIRKAYAKLHPGKTVPLLVHNGHPVYESHEQIRYAAMHSPDPTKCLIPQDSELHQQMEKWIDLSSLSNDPLNEAHLSAGNAVPGQTLPLFATMIEKVPYLSIWEGFLFHFDKRRPALFTLMKLLGLKAFDKVTLLQQALATSRRHLHTHLDALETQLASSDGPWILGAEYSLADVSWMVIFERLRQADSLQVFANESDRPHCLRYWQQLMQRPAYNTAITQHEHPIVVHGTTRLQQEKLRDSKVKVLLEGAH